MEKPVNIPEKEDTSTQFKFDTPASMTLPYPSLDGHQRRIMPIPISVPPPPPVKTFPNVRPPPPNKTGWYSSELGGGWYKTAELLEEEEKAEEREKAEKAAGKNSVKIQKRWVSNMQGTKKR